MSQIDLFKNYLYSERPWVKKNTLKKQQKMLLWAYNKQDSQSGTGNDGNEIFRSPELEPHYQMQFNVIPRIFFSVEWCVNLLQGGYIQHILSSVDRACLYKGLHDIYT